MVLRVHHPHSHLTLDWSIRCVGRRARIVDYYSCTVRGSNIITSESLVSVEVCSVDIDCSY